jgi:hypothetical protein
MNESFTFDGGYIGAEVRFHTNGIYGTGMHGHPLLVATLDFMLRGPRQPGRCYDFRELRCRLSPFDATYIATSLPAHLNVRLESGQELPSHLVHLEIPLDRPRLATINRMRNGGDVALRLDLELFVDEQIGVAQIKDGARPTVWGHYERYRSQSKLHTSIARSTWVEQVLKNTGFSQVHILELPAIPIESCASMKASHDALQQAVKLESQGFYNEAVGKCRIALEPFFVMVEKPGKKGEKKQVPVLNPAWQKRLGKITYEWLNAAFVTMKQPTNKAHHISSTHFNQLDAQMLIAITTALVAYAVKTQPTTSPAS